MNPDTRGAVLLAPVEQRWECLSCNHTDVTRETRPHTRMHPCRGLYGLKIPMVPAGTKGKQTMVERGDYIGAEDVQYAGNGRPVMSVVTTRDDGQDCVVYAPCATATVRS